MGKGSNVQKKQAAQLKNLKDKGKSDEERKASAAKAKKDAAAFCCAICKQTFMVNSKPPTLYLHCEAKHPGVNFLECFPVELKDFDPSDPKGEKKAEEDKKKAATIKAKAKLQANADLDSLLDAGISKKGKK